MTDQRLRQLERQAAASGTSADAAALMTYRLRLGWCGLCGQRQAVQPGPLCAPCLLDEDHMLFCIARPVGAEAKVHFQSAAIPTKTVCGRDINAHKFYLASGWSRDNGSRCDVTCKNCLRGGLVAAQGLGSASFDTATPLPFKVTSLEGVRAGRVHARRPYAGNSLLKIRWEW